jgi:hypothetical protein
MDEASGERSRPMVFTPYMVLILVGFGAFMGALFVVSHWSRAAPPPARTAEAPPKPAPARKAA